MRVGPKSSDSVLVTDRKDTQGRRPRDNGGRDWSDAATSQGMPRLARATRAGRSSPRGITALLTLSSLQNCKRIIFCCLKPPSLWYFEWQPQETHTGVPMVHPARFGVLLLCQAQLRQLTHIYQMNEHFSNALALHLTLNYKNLHTAFQIVRVYESTL